MHFVRIEGSDVIVNLLASGRQLAAANEVASGIVWVDRNAVPIIKCP